MSYDLFFLDDEFGTVTEFHGILTDDFLIQSTRERYMSEERNQKYRYILNDYTGCTKIDVSSETVRQVARMAIDVSLHNPDIVIAGVMPTDLEFGLGRMWQAYAEKTGWKSQVVRSRPEAEDWIKSTLGLALHFNESS